MSIKKFPSAERIVIVCCCVMAFFTDLAIAHGDTTLYSEAFRKLYLYSVLLSLAIALCFVPGIKKRFDPVCLAPVVIFTYIILNAYTFSFGKVFDSIYSMLRIMVFLCLTTQGMVKVFDLFRKFLIVMSVFGIIAFVAYVLSLPLPHSSVSYYAESGFAQYENYGFSILFSEFGAIRLCGLFNEPGAMGTFIGLVLAADNFRWSNKGNRILLLAGCLTFSMAFFAIILLNFIIRSYKKPKVIIPLLLFVGIFIILAQQTYDSLILKAFFERFSFSDTGTVKAFVRSTDVIDNYFLNVIHGDHFSWGFGSGFVSTLEQGGTSTYETLVIDNGVLGCLLTLGFTFWMAFRKAKGNIGAIALVLCFIASIYQRPNIFTTAYFVVLFGGIEYGKYNASIAPPTKKEPKKKKKLLQTNPIVVEDKPYV